MIKDLKELQALLKLCRKQGVDEITLDGTVIKFGALPVKKSGDVETDDGEPDIPDEQLIFFSSRPPEGT
jgi:hypothetical protein